PYGATQLLRIAVRTDNQVGLTRGGLQQGHKHRRLRLLGEVRIFSVSYDPHYLYARSIPRLVVSAEGIRLRAEQLARERFVDHRYARRILIVRSEERRVGKECRRWGLSHP